MTHRASCCIQSHVDQGHSDPVVVSIGMKATGGDAGNATPLIDPSVRVGAVLMAVQQQILMVPQKTGGEFPIGGVGERVMDQRQTETRKLVTVAVSRKAHDLV